MKVILLLALLSLSLCEDGCTDQPATSYSDCKELPVETGDTCCFYSTTAASQTSSACVSLSADEMKDLDKVKEDAEKVYKDGGIEATLTIKCSEDTGNGDSSKSKSTDASKTTDESSDDSSNYLSISLIILLSLLF